MRKRKSICSILSNIIIIAMLIIVVIVYKKYDYNYYSKGIAEAGKTSFLRDSSNKYNDKKSYKIENKDFNDAMFYREIEVKQFTPYKVSCMVKTEDVEQFENAQLAGVQIVLKNTSEHSNVISGTNDWTKLEFYFNSKNNSTVQLGFRLGGNGLKAKGTAWIADITMEEGFQAKNSNTTWNFACFLIDNVNAKLDNGYEVQETLTNTDIDNIKNTMRRFKQTANELSQNKMTVEYDIIEIKEPITTLSHDDENGFYISENDVYNLIQKYVKKSEYDHIYVCTKLPNEQDMSNEEKVNWIGLGNMQYCGKGFSDIRILQEDSSFYRFSNKNTFPEEVFIHEFLHTLERNAGEYGYTVPALHDNAKYGYQENAIDGLRIWYKDYMNGEIKSNGEFIGLPAEIFAYKPVQPSNFTYSNKVGYLDEPHGIIEIIKNLVDRVKLIFKKTEEEKTIEIISQ